MEFEWDTNKSQLCFEQRGFDFAYAAQVFFDPNRHIEPDQRHDYGEQRYRLFGHVNGRMLVVVYTLRENRVRIISARKANQKEVRQHDYGTHDHQPR